ncbi:MAG: paraquat-inducible protein A [Chthoniobacteraceae bacterium]
MTIAARYRLAMALIVLTLALLLPGLTQNALTIRGVLDVESIGAAVDRIASAAIPHERLGFIRRSLNQDTLAKFNDQELSEFIGRVAGAIVRGKLEGARAQLAATTVYEQRQTILVTIRYLFEHGGYWAATLLLMFSVCVPLGKVVLFFHAIHARPERREKVLGFINVIGKWSMADVFVVAIYTAYLGAQNSVGVGQPVHFETEYGPGFYWFSAYCLVSLAAQQVAVALMRERNGGAGS